MERKPWVTPSVIVASLVVTEGVNAQGVPEMTSDDLGS
jgi:hypothetical protein